MFKSLDTQHLEMPFEVTVPMTDEEILEAVKPYVSAAKDLAELELEEKLENAVYPRFGYTTAQVFENSDEYEVFLRQALAEEVEEYEEALIRIVKAAMPS